MTSRIRTLAMLVLAVCAALGLSDRTAIAQGKATRAELKERFERRHDDLNRLKEQGRVGETWNGLVEAVDDESELNAEARRLIDQENADRRRLYDLIADDVVEGEKRISPEKVAERNARRNFTNAKPKEFLKTREGFWFQRNDINPLKREGKAGETWEGYVAAVKGAGLTERERALIDLENRIRKEIYDRQADKRGTSVKEEARRAGRKNLDNASKGEHIQTEGGWERKQR